MATNKVNKQLHPIALTIALSHQKNKTLVNNSAMGQAGLLKDYLRKSKEKVVCHQNLGSLL